MVYWYGHSPQDRLARMVRGCTFDDFLVPPGWGMAKTRSDISLVSKFSTNVKLNVPLVSANMDTITGARMAAVMAKHGGIGVIHRYLNIEDQRKKIEEVKRQESFVIDKPYSISPDATIEDAKMVMGKNKVGSIVVLDASGRLLGLLSSRDVRFASNHQKVSERMKQTDRLVVVRPTVTLIEAKELLDTYRLEKLPIVEEDFRLCGLITSKDIENLEKYPFANKDADGRFVVGAAIGATGDYLERAAELINAGVDVIVIDIANAQSVVGERAVLEFRKKFPDFELVVGNIVLPEAVERFQALGVNGLKVGLGPGSACTTRKNTNIGLPQAQAVFECAINSAIPINADGGIKRDGHISLALLLGADSVMIGGLFAGTDETPGLVFRNSEGREVKSFRGMASREAMHEKLKAEEANDPYEISSRMSPEGIERQVEYRGSVVPIIKEMVGHLASMVSYMGARSLEEAKEIFMDSPQRHLVKLSEASKRESFQR